MEVAVVESLLGIVGALNLTLLGWLFMRQNALAKTVDEKVDRSDFKATQSDIKKILESITELKVELARWQGRAEAKETNSARS